MLEQALTNLLLNACDASPAGSSVLLSVHIQTDKLLFVVDDQGDLRYTRQITNDQGRIDGWRPLFPIAAGRHNAIFAVGRDGSGYSEAFSVTPRNELFRFWQSPQTEQWFSEVIEAARRVTGRAIPAVKSERRAGDAAVLVASSEKIRRELGWVPQYPDLDSIILSAWEWIRRHTSPSRQGFGKREPAVVW